MITRIENISSETKLFIEKHINSNVQKLALQKEKYPNIPFTWALQQIAARQKYGIKYPLYSKNLSFLFPVSISIEQSSSEETACYKASLLQGERLVDLTAGFGIDSLAFSTRFKEVISVEPNEALCELLQHNVAVLGINNLSVKQGSAETVLESMLDRVGETTFYIDPSRRDEKGERVLSLSDYQPNLDFLKRLVALPSAGILIKLSPMLDIKELQRQIPDIRAIYVVAVRNECKEVLLHCHHEETTATTPIYAVNVLQNSTNVFPFYPSENNAQIIPSDVKKYIYEPNVAIMKAGAYNALLSHYAVEKLDRHTHLYTSNEKLSHFPGKVYSVLEVLPFDKKEIKKVKGGAFQLACKNFPTSVDALRKQLKTKEKGDVHLIATTVKGKHQLIICEKPSYY